MRPRFQFSLPRLLVSMALLCLSLSLFSWAMNGPMPLLFFYFATIALGVALANLIARPLSGAVGTMLFWTGFMLIRVALGASWFSLLTAALVLAAFLGGMATQRYLDRRRRRLTMNENPYRPPRQQGAQL